MIKKLILVMTAVVMTLSVSAQEFKVGDVKYTVLSDGTAEIKEAKKASGDYEVAATVVDPKSKKEYKVTSIGSRAFKKAPVTSVTLPNTISTIEYYAFQECGELKSITLPESVTEIGSAAFDRCGQLSSVKLPASFTKIPSGCFTGCISLTSYNLDGIEVIERAAFKGTGLKSVTIPASVSKIDDSAFFACNDLSEFVVSESDQPLVFGSSVFYGTPLKEIVIARPIVYAGAKNADISNTNRPFSNNGALESATIIGKGVGNYPELLSGCTGLKSVKFEQLDYYGVYSHEFANLYASIPETVAVMTLNGDSDLSGDRKELINEIHKKADFLKKWNEFVSYALYDPKNISIAYRKMEPSEVKANLDIVKPQTYQIIDLYMEKDSLNNDELELISGLINNCFMFIGYDYGKQNILLEDWARGDMLRKDIENNAHKEDYEYILNAIETYFMHQDLDNDDYHQAMQMAALCGLGRWAEAARYYPKLHRFMTDNGRREAPMEFEYMRTVMNEHGQKVAKPVYKKASSSASSKSNDGGLIEFFTDRAINGAVNRYERKKAEKRAREMLYDTKKK